MKIGFIGVGNIGAPIAVQLLQAGHVPVVHAIRPGAASALLAAASSPAAVAADCGVVATCVPGPVEMEQVCLGPAGIAERLKAGALYIDHTSNSPALVRRVHAMLYAPVSGGMEDAQTRPAGHGQRRAGPPLSARDIRTFAGTSGNDGDALIPVIATSARQWRCRGTWSRRAAIERPAALSPNGYGAAIIRYRAAILDRPQSVRPERSWERF